MIELACGHGRHSVVTAPRCKKLLLMDVLESNIAFCKDRFSIHPRVAYLVNNGYDFQPVDKNTISAIYCYDAMVHFHPDVVRSYLLDSARVLKLGGRALYHHSNFSGPGAANYMQNPHARNVMTRDRFAEYANEAGLKVIESITMHWSEAKDLDCLTLLEKM